MTRIAMIKCQDCGLVMYNNGHLSNDAMSDLFVAHWLVNHDIDPAPKQDMRN